MPDVPSNLIPTRVTQLPVAPVADENSLMMIVYQGNNYQIRVGDLLSVAGVPVTRAVLAGTGMAGGGQLSSNVTLSIAPGGVGSAELANSGVTPGVYGTSTNIPVFTVDATGRITAATTIPATISGYVPDTRQIIAGTGLAGGGSLNTDVTLNADFSNATPQVLDNAGSSGVSTQISRADHVHPAVDLSDQAQINGILPVDQGGTSRSLVPDAGAIVWSGADGLYIGPTGVYGQVLISGGTGEYIWADQSSLSVGWANNLNGGALNKILYQTAPDTTAFVDAPVSADTYLKFDGSGLVWGALAGAGTVTSVGLALPTEFTISNSPVTSSGTLTGAWASQTANYVLAAPDGLSGTPSFRALTATDVPTAGAVSNAVTFDNTGGDAAGTSFDGSAVVTVDYSTVGAAAADGTNASGTWAIDISGNAATATSATSASSASTATNISGGLVDQIPVQTGAGATSFIVAPTVPNTYLQWSGTVFQWGANPLGTVTSVGLSLPSEFTISNSPVTSSGTLTGIWASQTANYVLAAPNGSPGTPSFRALTATDVPTAGSVSNSATFNNSGTGDASPQTFNGSAAITVSYNTIGAANSGANTNITSIDSITGGIATPDFINFDNALVAAPTTVEGGLYYNNDDNTSTLQLIGNNGINLKLNEEQYYRVKASATITKGQVVMFTGTLGASGGLIAAPATGLTADQSNYLLGVATESIANNNWGYVTFFGEIKGINTTGGAESWVDGTVLYYNPAVTGGLTKNKPAVPNAISIVAAVVYAHASNGILFVRPTFGSVLGGTDGNVSFGTLTGGDIIVYDGTSQYWKNAAQSTLAAGSATNLAGGAASQIPYQTGAGATTFLANGTAGQVLLSNGAAAPSWSGISGGTF